VGKIVIEVIKRTGKDHLSTIKKQREWIATNHLDIKEQSKSKRYIIFNHFKTIM
jgi:hypothetical protein